jgi:hypothetical protein
VIAKFRVMRELREAFLAWNAKGVRGVFSFNWKQNFFMDNSAKKPQKIRIWQRIAIFAAFFSLISGGVLLANW